MVGHIKKVCRARKSATTASKVAAIDFKEPDSEEDYTTLAVGVKGEHIYHSITVRGRSADFIVDTGSPISFMACDAFKAWLPRRLPIRPTTASITGVTGHNLRVIGEVQLQVTDFNSTQPVLLQLRITDRGPAVLGLDGLRALQVKVALGTSQFDTMDTPSNQIGQLLKKCSSTIGGIVMPPLQLVVSSDPVFCKARSVPLGLRAAVEDNIKKLVADGVLTPVKTSSWATPIVTPL